MVIVSHSNVIPWFLIKAGLAEDCWKATGIISTFYDPEPRIDGYDNLWRIERVLKAGTECDRIKLLKF